MRANIEGGQYQYLVDLMGGVILLGTSHRASSAQTLGSMIAKTAQGVQWGENALLIDVAEGVNGVGKSRT